MILYNILQLCIYKLKYSETNDNFNDKFYVFQTILCGELRLKNNRQNKMHLSITKMANAG